MRVFAVAAVLTLAVMSSSCSVLHRSQKSAKTARPPQPVLVMPPAAAPQRIQMVSVLPPPELPAQEPGTWMPPPVEERLPPAPRPPRRTRIRESAELPVSTQPEPSAEPAVQIPQLEQILTADQQQAYNDEIDRNISRAQRTVAVLNGRRLSSEQKTYLDRIRTFLQQAAEARKTDLFRARNLAERASVLADDLAKSLQ